MRVNAGDLVKFKNCRQAGSVGVVIQANKNSSPECVHFVALAGGKQMWFTTNQLEVISASR